AVHQTRRTRGDGAVAVAGTTGGLDRVQPRLELVECLSPHRGRVGPDVGARPADMRAGIAVRGQHALPDDGRTVPLVEVAGRVGVVADLDDRDPRQAAGHHVDAAGLVRPLDRRQARLRARLGPVAVDVHAADAFVQGDELLDVDGTGLQRLPAELDADVVGLHPQATAL